MTPTSPAGAPTHRHHARQRSKAARTTFAVAAVLSWLAMVPVGFFYAASGLVVPGPWLFLMWILYGVLLVAAVVLTRRRSILVVLPPVIGGVLWWAIVTAGEEWLGWTG